MDTYELEKPIWTDADFDRMGWHDCRIHAMAFNPAAREFLLDIDYIFAWVQPPAGETYFKFWLAPATLVFEDSSDMGIDVSTWSNLEIDRVLRSDPQRSPNGQTTFTYTIECQEGEIRIEASGYRMFVKQIPMLQRGQVLEIAKRGGYTFSRDLKPQAL
jgi:hypothetical protein